MSIYRATEGSGLTGSVTLCRDEIGFTQGSADLLFADGAAIRSELFLDEAFGYVPTEEEEAPERDYPCVLTYAADLSMEEESEEPETEADREDSEEPETKADGEAAGETAEPDAAESPAEETEEDFYGMVGAPALLVLELTDSVLKVQRMEALFLDEYRPADADLTVYTLIAEEAESSD